MRLLWSRTNISQISNSLGGLWFDSEVLLHEEFSPKCCPLHLPLLHDEVQCLPCALGVGNGPHVEWKYRVIGIHCLYVAHLVREEKGVTWLQTNQLCPLMSHDHGPISSIHYVTWSWTNQLYPIHHMIIDQSAPSIMSHDHGPISSILYKQPLFHYDMSYMKGFWNINLLLSNTVWAPQ